MTSTLPTVMRSRSRTLFLSILILSGVVLAVQAPIAEAQDLRIFVTSTTYQGDLDDGSGGLAGGDARCEARATAAGLGGTWVAWLSTSTVDAKDRLTEPAGVFTRVDGVTQVADDIADLTDNSLDNAILLDENGTSAGIATVYTGSEAIGTKRLGLMCNDWTDGTSGSNGQTGRRADTNSWWASYLSMTCDTSARLYCFEVPSPAPVPASDWRGMALLAILMLAGSLYLRRYRAA